MELIKIIEIENPPTKYVDRLKTKIDPNTGELKKNVYYLTGNIFYSSVSWHVRRKIVDGVKNYLMKHMTGIPKLQKCRINVIYQKNDDRFDLDNKLHFWVKIFLDLLKTPTKRQLNKAYLRGRDIKSVNVLDDDTVRFIDEMNFKFQRGDHKLIFEIYGIKKPTSNELFK